SYVVGACTAGKQVHGEAIPISMWMSIWHAGAFPEREHSVVEPWPCHGFSVFRIDKYSIASIRLTSVSLSFQGKKQFLMNRQHHTRFPFLREPIDFAGLPVDFVPGKPDGIRSAESRPPQKQESE